MNNVWMKEILKPVYENDKEKKERILKTRGKMIQVKRKGRTQILTVQLPRKKTINELDKSLEIRIK